MRASDEVVVNRGPQHDPWVGPVVRLGLAPPEAPHFDDVDAFIRELYALLADGDAIKWPGWRVREAHGLLWMRWMYATGRVTDD